MSAFFKRYFATSLLAFTAKFGVPINQWTWLYEVLLEVSMTKIALWIRVYVDDWTAESAVIASNGGEFLTTTIRSIC